MKSTGKVVGVNGNMVSVEIAGDVKLNEVGYVVTGGKEAEIRGYPYYTVIKVQMQVFEITKGIGIGDPVEFY